MPIELTRLWWRFTEGCWCSMKIELTHEEIWAILNAISKDAKDKFVFSDETNPLKMAWFKLSGQVTGNA